MRSLWTTWIVAGGLVSLSGAQDLDPPMTFHASFEGTLEATARGDGTPVQVEGPVEYRPGRAGQALLCGEGGALVHYATEGNLRASSGTVEMWVCPLDWTGEKDVFHSFFEARDPGWLVLYRYYQGGILMLMGSDMRTYRAAAGPRIKWTPGEWHHIAGTWRAKGLAVYVDGEQAGVVPDPPMPERLADTFRIGDHPWHVPRQQQTLVDEVKLYAAPLDAESIARAARGEPIQYTPEPVIDLAADPDAGTLEVVCDAAGLVGDMGPGRTARVALVPARGDQAVAEATIDTFAAEVGRCQLAVGDVAEGEYEVRAEVLDDAGAVCAMTAERFARPGPPVWSGNELGMEDDVLPPWTPLKTDETASAFACWGREYAFGTLLSRCSSSGEELLAGPVRLEAVVNGKTVALAGDACRVDTATDTRATLTGEARAGGLHATLRHEIEYDGFTWTELALQPADDVVLDELRLTWAMPAQQSTLMHADAGRWIHNQAGALEPEGWSSDWLHFFWLGDEERGLAWYAESQQYWQPSEEKPTIQAVREGDVVNVTVRMIAEPVTVTDELRYGFGMMATPARPRPSDARRWRMAPGVQPTFRIIWPNNNMKYYGYPEPEDPGKFAEMVRSSHDEGCLVVPYVNLNYMSAGAPEWGYYGQRWADPARAVTPSDVAAMGYASMGTCPQIRDWQDFILYRINEMIDRYEVDGIYIDCWNPYPCKVGGCGWTDAEGKVQPTRPIRAYRQIIRRVYSLFAQKRPEPLLMVHMSSQVVIPMLSFTHTILDGEQFRSGNLQDDYLDLLPPDMFRAEFMGRNWGPVAFFLPEFRDEYKTAGTPNLAAYLMLHDVNAWPIWSEIEPWNRLYEAADALGIAEADFLPYWEDSGVEADPQVLVSAYVRDGRAMLAVMNTGDQIEAKLSLDSERLGLADLREAVDVLRGEAMALDGRTITVPLHRRQGRVIELKKGTGAI
jgi:hypothetical protein